MSKRKQLTKQPIVPSADLCARWVKILRSPQTTTFYPDDARALGLLANWLDELRTMDDADFQRAKAAERERAERAERERAEREERERLEREAREEREHEESTRAELERQEAIASQERERERSAEPTE